MNSTASATGNSFADRVAHLGGNWGWVLAFGVLSVLVGIAALLDTRATLLVIAAIFGLQLLFGGIFRFMHTFSIPGHHGWLRGLTGLLALVSIVVGVYLIAHPVLSLLVLAFLLGIFWIIEGVVELFLAIESHDIPGRAWTAVSGVLGIVAGLFLVFFPGISLVALAIFLGVWLVLFGVMQVLAALALRSHHRASSVGSRPQPVGTGV